MNIKREKQWLLNLVVGGQFLPCIKKEVWRKTVQTTEVLFPSHFTHFKTFFFFTFSHFKTWINLIIAVGHSCHCLNEPIKTQQRDFPGGQWLGPPAPNTWGAGSIP